MNKNINILLPFDCGSEVNDISNNGKKFILQDNLELINRFFQLFRKYSIYFNLFYI